MAVYLALFVFSRDEATLYEGVSVRPSVRPLVRPSVTLSLYGLLGATYAVYTAMWFYCSSSFPPFLRGLVFSL